MVRIRNLFTFQGIVSLLVILALLFAAISFAYSLNQTRDLADQNRTIIAAQAADAKRHCLKDAHNANKQRTLDLRLIVADRAVLSHLHSLPNLSPRDLVLIGYYQSALSARLADIPAYTNPESCAP